MTFDAKQTTLSHLEIALQNDKVYLSQEDRLKQRNLLDAAFQFAAFFRSQGRYKAAEEMIRRALEGDEKALGVEHPDTLTTVYCRAHSLHAQRQYDAASLLYKRAAVGYQKMLGPYHPTTLACSRHYSSMLDEMNRRVPGSRLT